MLWGRRRGQGTIVATEPTECPMPQANDLSRCLLTLEQDSTLIAVVELSQASWLVTGIVPVGERTRIVNRMRSALARLGVRGFKPTLRKASERLATLRTAEGVPLPPNTLAELGRDMARLRFVTDQIKEVEAARLERLARRPE